MKYVVRACACTCARACVRVRVCVHACVCVRACMRACEVMQWRCVFDVGARHIATEVELLLKTVDVYRLHEKKKVVGGRRERTEKNTTERGSAIQTSESLTVLNNVPDPSTSTGRSDTISFVFEIFKKQSF